MAKKKKPLSIEALVKDRTNGLDVLTRKMDLVFDSQGAASNDAIDLIANLKPTLKELTSHGITAPVINFFHEACLRRINERPDDVRLKYVMVCKELKLKPVQSAQASPASTSKGAPPKTVRQPQLVGIGAR